MKIILHKNDLYAVKKNPKTNMKHSKALLIRIMKKNKTVTQLKY
ncbi:unnamed protein product [Commensalibacter communis]|nr:unnamed protein product [Commensalibacter communis]CAI3941454.1 unnamed protein product [Commensalibacter communis]